MYVQPARNHSISGFSSLVCLPKSSCPNFLFWVFSTGEPTVVTPNISPACVFYFLLVRYSRNKLLLLDGKVIFLPNQLHRVSTLLKKGSISAGLNSGPYERQSSFPGPFKRCFICNLDLIGCKFYLAEYGVPRICMVFKGQLVSDWNFGLQFFPKMQGKNCKIFCPKI